MNLPGGHHGTQVTQEHKNLVKAHTAQINQKTGCNAAEWHIDSATSQVVAGTNYTFILSSGNNKVQAHFFQPLPYTHEPAKLTSAKKL